MTNTHNIIILVLLTCIVIYLILPSNIENFATTTEQSNEAIQNVASIYNTSQMSLSNLAITGNLKVPTTAGGFNLLPTGMITMWNGTVPPAGWVLCDGTNGTPDLRGRFVLGMGQGTGQTNGINMTNRVLGATGGAETHTQLIAEMPAHTHNALQQGGVISGGFCYGSGCNVSNPSQATSSTGGGQPFTIMPPFYVLAYIMKV